MTRELREAQKLKTAISEELLAHIAEKLDMTVSEYGLVYDSEKHEDLLNRIMRLIDRYAAEREKFNREKGGKR